MEETVCAGSALFIVDDPMDHPISWKPELPFSAG
jgi:hypothetical protein